MSNRHSAGFSLVELMFVIVIIGSVIAMGISSFRGYRQAYDLRAATENIGGQLKLAREKALAVDSTQTIHFAQDSLNTDYHIHTNGVFGPSWKLPKGITYYWGAGTTTGYRMAGSGRCLDSGLIILQDARGNRDTVSVLASGLVITR